ncbi:cyclic nucleotide-gated ion channel 1-like [Carya illinoinensis]|uniref:cyclic nucleotide-gated ion channel 1-like n=1 Tax=Carya illinoinensis TaxID=32201 RepID=UPI001C71DADB|nr:cyclic nucleotide-gated ion channel 1-like [Carya illinoinensis]
MHCYRYHFENHCYLCAIVPGFGCSWGSGCKKNKELPDMKCSDYVINILSILPVHQVLMPIIFSEMSTSNIENIEKFLNAVVLSQYVPRIFRIYRLWKIVNETNILPKRSKRVNVEISSKNLIPPKGFVVMRAGFNLLLYLVASHVKNPLFNFGIFEDARKSGILSSMDFLQKIMFCFWWGLRNLRFFGQNLNTSPFYWENCFAVLISIFGLLLFLYFIGNLQIGIYMQWDASNKLDEIKSKWLKNKEEKLHSIENWISKLGQLPDDLKNMIMDNVTRILEDQNNAFDTENPFPYLSEEIRRRIKINLCLPLLRRVSFDPLASF